VQTQEVGRGRRIENGSISTPTVAWGQSDNSAVDLFDTAALVAPIDCTIFEAAVAIEVGNDFLSDAAVQVGAILTQLIGERLAAELDRLVAVGNGTTEPEGIFTASGTTSDPTDNGASGPPTLADYQSLYFSLPKQYRTPAMRPCFVSNDTTYARSRQIKVDTATPSVDQRPVISPVNNIGDYMTLALPHRINNDIGNGSTACVALSRYKMYRRMGLSIQWSREGQYLMRRNLSLLVARARFGGRLRDATACAKWTNGQS
jgi:HK97 family phage major capsid protein